MKKPFFVLVACLIIGGGATAQVKLGNNPAAINASSLIEMESTNKGMVAPRVALTSLNSPSPLSAGLLTGTTVYNTATAGTGVNTVYANHYYFWNGTTWSQVADQDASIVMLVPVLDNTITTPPFTHTDGDSYIVPTGATGVWAGNTNKIATWSDNANAWVFYTPVANNQTTVTTGTNAGKTYKYDGTTWNQIVAPVTVYWQPGGNTGLTTSNNTLGTAAYLPLRFITKGVERMVIDTLFNIKMGYNNNVASKQLSGAWGYADTATGAGVGAWAIGFANKATGDRSVAIGTGNVASGNFSSAIGFLTTASNQQAFATGSYTVASGNAAFASGNTSTASGAGSTAMGNSTIALGDNSTALGYGSIASNPHTGVWGVQDTATGTNAGAWAIGYQNKALGDRSVALGMTTLASNTYATSMGAFTTASGNTSTAIGYQTTASGSQSTAMGLNSAATGTASTAMGSGTKALSDYATAMGSGSVAANPHSGVWGVSDSATGTNAGAWAIGFQNKALGDRSVALGMTTLANNIYATSMGAFTTASGNTSTAIGYQTVASGPQSTAMGFQTLASGTVSTAMGSNTKALSDNTTAMGSNSVAANPHSGVWGVNDSATGTNSGAWAIGFNSKAMGDRSVALGSYTNMTHVGSFGLGDLSNTSAFLNSTANNQMSARFAGGYIFYTNNSTTIGVALGAGGTSWTSVSDRRSKENIQSLNYGLSSVMKLQPVSYRYKGNENTSIGFIAQDVKVVVPEVVDQTKMGPDHDYLGVRYSELVPVLTKAIQEQQQLIEQLTKRVRDLEAKK